MRFLDLSLRGLVVGEEQLARELLRQRARAVHPAMNDVVDQRDDDARNAQPDVLVEPVVFRREDGLLEFRRDGFVGNDLAPLDRELADDLAARAVHARDRARRVVVERGDLGEVAGVGEEHPVAMPSTAASEEQNDDDGAASETCKAHEAGSDDLSRLTAAARGRPLSRQSSAFRVSRRERLPVPSTAAAARRRFARRLRPAGDLTPPEASDPTDGTGAADCGGGLEGAGALRSGAGRDGAAETDAIRRSAGALRAA